MKFLLKQKKRSAVSPVIATLLLIAIAVAAAIIVYTFVTGLIGGLSGGAGSNLVTVSGNFLVPSGTATGTLVLNIKNSANNPITGIIAAYPTGAGSFTGAGNVVTDTCMGQQTNGAVCGVGEPASAKFNYNGAIVCGIVAAGCVAINPLPVGSETSATDTVTQSIAGTVNSGQTYTIAITVTFSTGSPQTQLVSVTAQL